MKVCWTDRAVRDLEEAFDYVAADKEGAAARLARRLLNAGNSLVDTPMLGRPVGGGKRVFVVDRYLLFYRLTPGAVQVLRVVHGAQRKRGP